MNTVSERGIDRVVGGGGGGVYDCNLNSYEG